MTQIGTLYLQTRSSIVEPWHNLNTETYSSELSYLEQHARFTHLLAMWTALPEYVNHHFRIFDKELQP